MRMADKLGLTNEVKEMKLGKSFMKGEHQSFHTFRYDFMPASVDTTKRASVDIGEGHQVTVTVPHIEGSGTANTIFKGSKKPYQKECVLIIDHNTGEITLEKLSYNVQLKKTRAEGSSKIKVNTPVDNAFSSKKSPSAQKLSPQQKHSTFGRSSPIQKCSPLPRSPIKSPAASQQSPSNPSMPCLSFSSLSKPPANPEGLFSHANNEPQIDAPEIGVLSSSSSSDSSSSEDSSDSSSSDDDTTGPVLHHSEGVINGFGESPNRMETESAAPSSSPVAAHSASSLPSMPKFSQLSEDLKLSESDSDSD